MSENISGATDGEIRTSLQEDVRYAFRETVRLAEEVAFWKYHACYHRSIIMSAIPSVKVPPIHISEKFYDAALRDLEQQRREENKNRYDAEPSHEIMS